jgi:hypothetical protein
MRFGGNTIRGSNPRSSADGQVLDLQGGLTMTGPEHYHEAQQLLADPNYGEPKGIGRSETIAAAQVHATLALAAATALAGDNALDLQAWRVAAGAESTDLRGAQRPR